MQVLSKIKKCGEILKKASYIRGTTYTTSENYETTTQTRIDQWSIRIRERGGYYCYPLTFVTENLPPLESGAGVNKKLPIRAKVSKQGATPARINQSFPNQHSLRASLLA